MWRHLTYFFGSFYFFVSELLGLAAVVAGLLVVVGGFLVCFLTLTVGGGGSRTGVWKGEHN